MHAEPVFLPLRDFMMRDTVRIGHEEILDKDAPSPFDASHDEMVAANKKVADSTLAEVRRILRTGNRGLLLRAAAPLTLLILVIIGNA